jgi:hypothetical protein
VYADNDPVNKSDPNGHDLEDNNQNERENAQIGINGLQRDGVITNAQAAVMRDHADHKESVRQANEDPKSREGPLDQGFAADLAGKVLAGTTNKLGAAQRSGSNPASQPAFSEPTISPARAAHILGGDKSGGGHRAGTGSPGKSEFPGSWSDAKILDAVTNVGRSGQVVGPGRNAGSVEKTGIVDGVTITTIVGRDNGILTGFPRAGNGVHHNPK